jgi:hypothetical protein
VRSESEGGKRGWGKATLDYLAEVCIWFGLFAVSASLLIGLQNALVASFRMRDYHELFYVSRLGVVAAVIVAVPWAALHLLERLLGRARFLVGLGVAAAVYPFARKVAVQLSLGDGVSALHVEIPMLVRATTAILCFGSLGVWAFQASRVWRALHVIAGSIGVAALVWFDAYYLRTYAILSPFVHVGALLVGAATLSHALSPWPRGRWVTAGCGASMVLLLAAIGVANPGFTDAGRRSVLADETSIYALDALLFRADIRAVQFDVTRASKQPCPELPKVAPWPELALPEEKRKNVILISVDALRKDVLGRKIAGKSITPQLDRFAREARVARRAYTSYPATLFALGGAMTGLLPSQILFAGAAARSQRVRRVAALGLVRAACVRPVRVPSSQSPHTLRCQGANRRNPQHPAAHAQDAAAARAVGALPRAARALSEARGLRLRRGQGRALSERGVVSRRRARSPARRAAQ